MTSRRGVAYDDSWSSTIVLVTCDYQRFYLAVFTVDDAHFQLHIGRMRYCGPEISELMLAQGIERTSSQWTSLLEAVGMEIVKIWRAEIGIDCVIEARLIS